MVPELVLIDRVAVVRRPDFQSPFSINTENRSACLSRIGLTLSARTTILQRSAVTGARRTQFFVRKVKWKHMNRH